MSASAGEHALLRGFQRMDGKKGIRNVVVVAYLVECAHHVAREIAEYFRESDPHVHLIGFPGCYPNGFADRIMRRLCTHPNVGAALLVSLGCESLIACGSHVVLGSTGRGSVVGSAISPVIKVCANPETFRKLEDDMDVDAGRILEGRATLDEVGQEVLARVLDCARGGSTRSEAMGHQEFILTYKTFEPSVAALGPACFPMRRS